MLRFVGFRGLGCLKGAEHLQTMNHIDREAFEESYGRVGGPQ